MAHRVLIVGGGFGGVSVARRLHKKRIADMHVMLLTDQPWITYYGTLYRVLRGHHPSQACIPLAMALPPCVRLVIDRAVSIDPVTKSVSGTSGTSYSYDTLILAPGSEPAYFGIPGMRERSFGMMSVSQALALRAQVRASIDAMASAQRKEDASLGQFTVVGAGPTGIEISGELAVYSRALARNRNIDPSRVTIHLIEAADRVLPIAEEAASRRVRRRLERLGVDIRTGRTVAAADEEGLRFADGSVLPAGTVVWTAGVQGSALLRSVVGLNVDKRGRVRVDEELRAAGASDIFVIGDCAATPYAGMAQTAVYDGTFVVRVLASRAAGKGSPPYRPHAPAYAIPAGRGWAAVKFGPLRVYGLPGYVLRRLADMHVYMLILPLRHVLLAFLGWIPLKRHGIGFSAGRSHV